MADDDNAPEDTETDASGTTDDTIDDPTPAESGAKSTDEVAEPARAGAGADGKDAPKKVVAKKKVVSKRVTPKGGATKGSTAAHSHAPGGDDADGSKRYTPPTAKYQDMPSPPWVPVVMFALLGFGCLFIIVNYAGLFGDPENWRLLVGLASILGGIIAATNYR